MHRGERTKGTDFRTALDGTGAVVDENNNSIVAVPVNGCACDSREVHGNGLECEGMRKRRQMNGGAAAAAAAGSKVENVIRNGGKGQSTPKRCLAAENGRMKKKDSGCDCVLAKYAGK